MSKPTISIKNLTEADSRPIVIRCEGIEEAAFRFEVLRNEDFTEPVEIEVLDEHGRRVEHGVVRPK